MPTVPSSDEAADFLRYLNAKRTIDERSLNRPVWERFLTELAALPPPSCLLEVGAGIGTMVERLARAGAIRGARYTAIDASAECVAAARERLAALDSLTGELVVELEAIDLYTFAEREGGRRSWDALLAHAFLDLVDLERALPRLLQLARPGAALYFTLNFDGGTVFAPAVDAELDARIEAAYHRTMDHRRHQGQAAGHSTTGRRLFGALRRLGVEVVVAGASDWVVFAGAGGFSADETFFLHYILDTVGKALRGGPDVDASVLAEWLEHRRAQIADGTLVYVAHQLDLLARR